MKEYHILNLGAGVQSTMLYLLACQNHEVMRGIDCAIFADTGEEPIEVYEHLEWLQSLSGPEIMVVRKGQNLGDALMGAGCDRDKNADIPAYTSDGGMLQRNCSGNYKRDVIVKAIREQICGLKPRQRFPRDEIIVHQYLGLSFDEAKRVLRFKMNAMRRLPWSVPRFPLFETNTTRAGCVGWLSGRVPHQTPRSACVFCPFRTNIEWQEMWHTPENMARAIGVDEGIRDLWPEQGKAYIHKSCVPLKHADISTLEPHPEFGFVRECEGMCGV